ncbi:MAG: transposase, partial [Candidatus Thiodiazotropha sp.]
LISLEATPYYHCVSRCVRRAFLCGRDKFTGKSFEHRREWIQKRLIELAGIFAIDLVGYAVMSNHVHTLLYIDKKTAESWEPQQVVKRWHQLFSGSLLSHRFIDGEPLSPAEYEVVNELITRWRAQLMDISWFMRCLNEPIARQANKEDNCTGRFWEGRYKSQALLDEKAIMTCLAYIDLNPIRAKMAETPEKLEFTSISDRVAELKRGISPDDNDHTGQPSHLYPFVGNLRDEMPKGLPYHLTDYMKLLD